MLESYLFWNVIIILGITLEWVVFKFIGDNLLKPKKTEFIKRILIMIQIVITTLLIALDVSVNIKLSIVIIMGWVLYIYSYNCKFSNALIINLVYWMILTGLDFVSFNLVLTINKNINIHELFKKNIPRLELIIISKLLLISIVPIVKSLNKNIEFKKNEALHIIILILTNILSIVVIFTLSMKCINKSFTYKLTLLVVSSLLILANLSLIKLIGKIIKANNIELENKLIREKMDMQYQYYLNIQEEQLKVRKLYHDMNNHVVCIKKLYENCGEVNAYINHIKSELNSWKAIISTENMILDIIINDKKKICDKNNINFEVDINFSKCDFIDMIDICSIFSNLIDNAIEACLKVKDKERVIILKGTIVNKFFALKCENNKLNDIKIDKEKIITNKKDKFIHGVGITSIKSSIKKYDGDMNINFSKDRFKVQIYIPLK